MIAIVLRRTVAIAFVYVRLYSAIANAKVE